jgi:hypothetical protein
MRNAFCLQFLIAPLLFFSVMQNDSCKSNKPAPLPRASTAPTATPKATASSKQLEPGLWGGNHISMQISETEITLEFDCAHGTISQPIKLDEAGRFAVAGTYVREGPGPVRQGSKPGTDAQYSGRLSAGTLTITVHIPGATGVGPYTLTEGRQGKLTKCY